jgi:nucleoporin SEH1
LSSDNYLRIYDCLELHNLTNWNASFTIDVSMAFPSATPPLSSPDIIGAPGTSLGASSNGRSYGSGVGGDRPGKREADGGWSLSWCKDKSWGQVLAVAAGTSGVVKVLQLSESRSHKLLFTLPENPNLSVETAAIATVSWAPSCGRRFQSIATGGRDGKLNIYKISPPQEDGRLGSTWEVKVAATFDEHQYVNHVSIGEYILI